MGVLFTNKKGYANFGGVAQGLLCIWQNCRRTCGS